MSSKRNSPGSRRRLPTGTTLATRDRRLDRLEVALAALPLPPDRAHRLQIEALADLAARHPESAAAAHALGCAVTGADWLDRVPIDTLAEIEALLVADLPAEG